MLRSRRLGVVILVLVLTVGDAALVTAALHRSHRADTAAAASAAVQPAGTSVVTPEVSPSPSGSSAPRPTRQPGGKIVAVSDGTNRLFTAAGTAIAWRAHGGCSGTPTLSMTTDGAHTWSTLTAPAPHLLRINLTADRDGWVIGVNSACGSPTYYGTVDGGTTWAASPTLGSVWLPLSDGVHTPSGTVTSACGHGVAPRDLAPSGTATALTICPTGVMRSTDAGATWRPVGKLPAGRSVTAALGAHGTGVLVVTGAPKCGGLRILTTTDVGASWTAGQCLAEAIQPASVGIATDGSGLLVSAGRAYTTTDAGQHWA